MAPAEPSPTVPGQPPVGDGPRPRRPGASSSASREPAVCSRRRVRLLRRRRGGRDHAERGTAAWRSWRLRPHVLRGVSAVDLGTTLLGSDVAHPDRRRALGLPGAGPSRRRAGHRARGGRGRGADDGVDVGEHARWPTSPPPSRTPRSGSSSTAALPRPHRRPRPPGRRGRLPGAGAHRRPAGARPAAARPARTTSRCRPTSAGQPPPAADPAAAAPRRGRSTTSRRFGELSGLPVVVKGVLRGDDAARCVQAGAAAVWVSTHGGRQADPVVASAHALPEVVAAVG